MPKDALYRRWCHICIHKRKCTCSQEYELYYCVMVHFVLFQKVSTLYLYTNSSPPPTPPHPPTPSFSITWKIFWVLNSTITLEIPVQLHTFLYFQELHNRPYSYSWYWTGTTLPLRLMQGIFANANDITPFFMIFPNWSLHCKLVPTQYREYEYVLLFQKPVRVFDSSQNQWLWMIGDGAMFDMSHFMKYFMHYCWTQTLCHFFTQLMNRHPKLSMLSSFPLLEI